MTDTLWMLTPDAYLRLGCEAPVGRSSASRTGSQTSSYVSSSTEDDAAAPTTISNRSHRADPEARRELGAGWSSPVSYGVKALTDRGRGRLGQGH